MRSANVRNDLKIQTYAEAKGTFFSLCLFASRSRLRTLDPEKFNGHQRDLSAIMWTLNPSSLQWLIYFFLSTYESRLDFQPFWESGCLWNAGSQNSWKSSLVWETMSVKLKWHEFTVGDHEIDCSWIYLLAIAVIDIIDCWLRTIVVMVQKAIEYRDWRFMVEKKICVWK